MKSILKQFLNILYSLLLIKYQITDGLWSNRFRFCSLNYSKSNKLHSKRSSFVKSSVNLKGNLNVVKLQQVSLMNSSIYIDGSNNLIEVDQNTHLNNLNIIIKGSDCKIKIGKNTTFFGGRVVNEGLENIIEVGNDCLFSDQVEIWSSDTHPIYNADNVQINTDKPIYIGNKVWVGCRASILKGVKISDGAVLGFGTIATKDVPKQTVSVGFPNKVIIENIKWERDYI